MATTTNYSFEKPTIGGDVSTWGSDLNSNWDDVDALLGGDTAINDIDIDSGTADGVVIGGATPAAGAFTTLSATGATTLQGAAILQGTTATLTLDPDGDSGTSSIKQNSGLVTIDIDPGAADANSGLQINVDNTIVGNFSATGLRLGDATDATVVFEVAGTSAILVPIGTAAQRPTGVNGYIRANSDDDTIEAYVGGSWTTLAAAAGAVSFTTLTATGLITMEAGVRETVHALSGTTPTIEPAADGTIMTWTLTGNSTPTITMSAGDSVRLEIDDGSAYTITWPSMQWIGGSAPTLDTTNVNVIDLYKVGSTLIGVFLGARS